MRKICFRALRDASECAISLVSPKRCMGNMSFRPFCGYRGRATFLTKSFLSTSMRCSTTNWREPTAPRDVPLTASGASNPMELLTRAFQVHPAALRLHRQLTIALANGDAEDAADLASTLARTVRKVLDRETNPIHPASSMSSNSPTNNALEEKCALPPASSADVSESVAAVERQILQMASSGDPNQRARPAAVRLRDSDVSPSSLLLCAEESFWRCPDCLCGTILEVTYEAMAPEGGEEGPLTVAGDHAVGEEGQAMAILDAYLVQEATRLRAQKNAVMKTIVAVAQTLGLTPEDLHASEGALLGRDRGVQSHSQPSGQAAGGLNALRHCNLVIRAEAPDMGIEKNDDNLNTKVREEVSVLKKRMRESGAPLSDIEEKMATYELMMMHTTMRYVVGIHRDVQVALDHSAGVAEYKKKSGAENQKGSSFFIEKVMQELHLTPEQSVSLKETENGADQLSVERLERTKVIQQPVIPFTYMLKCCLWFNIPLTGKS